MNPLLSHNSDDEIDDLSGRLQEGKDREITLGTTMVLGIFFALAVLCAIFFGFGYSLGTKRTATVEHVSQEAAPSSANIIGSKPSPGSPAGSSHATNQPAATTVTEPVTIPDAAPIAPRSAATLSVSKSETNRPANKPSPHVAPALETSTPVPAVVGAPQSVVQIAAVSHQEDADLLVSTLKRRGYKVGIHSEAQDKLLHVQVGPFSSRKDAETMRQRLLADGFNAIVK